LSAKRPGRPKKPSPRNKQGGSAARPSSTVGLRKAPGHDAWELVHPRCARDRQEDLEEVRKMIDAGELDIAIDECRWLLQGCSDCIDAHRLLGEIALSENDLPLARGHFGFAFRLGQLALERAGVRGPLPYSLPANQGFHESAKGLAWCLKQLGKPEMAREAAQLALDCDASDPLGLAKLLAS
jgi:hypothetical protein